MNRLRSNLFLILAFAPVLSFAQPGGKFVEVVTGTKDNPVVLATATGAFSLHFPEMAGSLQLGLAGEEDNFWLAEKKCDMKRDKNGNFVYSFKDPLGTGGNLTLKVSGSTQFQGFIMKIEAEDFIDDVQLCWALGGSYGEVLDDKTDSGIKPEFCEYNVFSVEGNAITVYYGESMRLRTLKALVPPGSNIRLSDARKQRSPVEFFESGKKTDAPALCALVDLINGKPLYFCIFRRADYNYFMLPDLFDQNFNSAQR